LYPGGRPFESRPGAPFGRSPRLGTRASEARRARLDTLVGFHYCGIGCDVLETRQAIAPAGQNAGDGPGGDGPLRTGGVRDGSAPSSPTNRGGFVQRPGRGALTSFTLVRVGHPLPFRRYRLLAGRSALNRERAGSNPPSATNRRRGGIGRPSPLKPGRAQRAGSMPAAGTTSCLRRRAW
jgi:hypothetical protein